MGLLDDVLGGWTSVAVAVGAPSIALLVRSVFRPVAKTLITAGLALADAVSGMLAGTPDNALPDAKETQKPAAHPALRQPARRNGAKATALPTARRACMRSGRAERHAWTGAW
jgi:hypothetical protein